MATAAFRLTLKDFGVCWLIPGEESYVGRRIGSCYGYCGFSAYS
nr:MAG TPA: hypothetical protein [Microviridae sp.]